MALAEGAGLLGAGVEVAEDTDSRLGLGLAFLLLWGKCFTFRCFDLGIFFKPHLALGCDFS